MSSELETDRFEQLWRDHAWLRWTLWLLLSFVAAYALLYVGFAQPTLYEGF